MLTKLWASFWYIEIGFWWTFEKNPNLEVKGYFEISLFTPEFGNFGNLILFGGGFGYDRTAPGMGPALGKFH